MAEVDQARSRDVGSALEEKVHGSLELDLVVQPGHNEAVVIRHVHISPRNTCQHIPVVGEFDVKSLLSI